MISNFPQIVKKHLKHLPQDGYPVLNTFLFVSTWLSFALDQSQVSMRSLFKRLNVRGINVDISAFSKASKIRDPGFFYYLFTKLREELKKEQKLALFPLDSTIVTLTSKLLWSQGYHQVKLFSGLNLLTAEPGGIVIHFGQGHNSKYGDLTIEATPPNGVSINVNGIESQIYSFLIAYVLLQLVKTPKEFGNKLLDKLRYLQAFMCENISYVHWLRKLVIC